MLRLRVSVAPSDGAANPAVLALVAKALKIPKSAVRIAAGETARVKRLEVDGVTADDIARAFGPEPPGSHRG